MRLRFHCACKASNTGVQRTIRTEAEEQAEAATAAATAATAAPEPHYTMHINADLEREQHRREEIAFSCDWSTTGALWELEPDVHVPF
jgi:hypothetical protein